MPNYNLLPTIKVNRTAATVTLPGKAMLYFSYETLVAFRDKKGNLFVRENTWGPTTGQHLAAVDGGNAAAIKDRLTSTKFEKVYQKAFPLPRRKVKITSVDVVISEDAASDGEKAGAETGAGLTIV